MRLVPRSVERELLRVSPARQRTMITVAIFLRLV
jgi:hypothetical protein